ncbi:MAG: tyrosine-protein phosphatase [Actinomycetota bacterium]
MDGDGPQFDEVLNFREMGGLPAAAGSTIRPGQLFRSGHWSKATDDDVDTLAEVGLTTVIDFRTEIDRTADGGPDRLPPDLRYLALEMVDESGMSHEIRSTLMSGDQGLVDARFGDGQAHRLATDGVVDMATDQTKQAVFGRFLATVADADRRPVLWHCSAGKDRAGWAATLLGIALGVPDEALMEHYLASNIHRPVESRIAHYRTLGIDAEVLRPFLSVHRDYLAAGLAAIDDGWPNRDAYLEQALGFGPDRVAVLRDQLLD